MFVESLTKKIKNVIIVDPKKFENLKNRISEDGVLKFYVISDFERTLTNLFIKGERTPSLISILRNGNYLNPGYSRLAKDLFDQYHPIEINSEIPLREKQKRITEWWKRHYEILIKFGFNKKHIKKVVNSERVKFREGSLEFLDFLYQYRIPLLIISSSGLGIEAVSMTFKKKGRLYPNIYVISNFLQWDGKGNLVGIKEPIIHSTNKNGSMIKKSSTFKVVKNRRNILLLGDNIEDCQTINGLNYKNVIKVGFLNEGVEKNLEAYKKNFDVLILNDGDMNFVNNLLKEMT